MREEIGGGGTYTGAEGWHRSLSRGCTVTDKVVRVSTAIRFFTAILAYLRGVWNGYPWLVMQLEHWAN
jgi:hypothetical protein